MRSINSRNVARSRANPNSGPTGQRSKSLDQDDRHGWIQTMPGYKNLTDLHQVVESQGYEATPNISA